MKMGKLGHWSFILGVAIAIIAGIASAAGIQIADVGTISMILVVLGVIIGFLNISEKEISNFLIAAIALLVTGAAGLDAIPAVGAILTNISTFVAPAAVIVALKAVYSLGKK